MTTPLAMEGCVVRGVFQRFMGVGYKPSVCVRICFYSVAVNFFAPQVKHYVLMHTSTSSQNPQIISHQTQKGMERDYIYFLTI